MKKVAILSLYDNLNFGNRLQSFAVQTYFEKLGFNVSVIPNLMHYPYYSIMQRLSVVKHFILRPTRQEKERRKSLALQMKRKAYMATFNEEYLKMEPNVIYHDKVDVGLKKRYDYFVTGSDQVWRCWTNNRNELNFFFLTFVEPSQRLTIAPSFGFNRFPDKFISAYKKCLDGFEYLSVREEQGAKLIKELTGRDATVLLDPTMLIEESEWYKILKRPRQYADNNYIFVYSLGPLNLGGFKGEIKEMVCGLADELGMQVIDIMDNNSDFFIHTRPDEFLYWIYNAKLVVTDSFHASVFSILFGRPFVVIKKRNNNVADSRLDTLLEKFGLEDRHYETQKQAFFDVTARNELFATHYEAVPEVLEAERKKAKEFYKKCFHEI